MFSQIFISNQTPNNNSFLNFSKPFSKLSIKLSSNYQHIDHKSPTNPTILLTMKSIKSSLRMTSERNVDNNMNANSGRKSTLIRVKNRLKKGVIEVLQKVIPPQQRMTRSQRQSLENSKQIGMEFTVIEMRGHITPVISWLVNDFQSNIEEVIEQPVMREGKGGIPKNISEQMNIGEDNHLKQSKLIRYNEEVIESENKSIDSVNASGGYRR